MATTTLATGLGRPQAITIDSAGNLYVPDYNTGTLYKVTSGGTTSTLATGLGGPFAITIDSAGNLYVPDSNTGTLYKVTQGTVTTNNHAKKSALALSGH